MRDIYVDAVPPGASLGYSLYQAGQPVGGRVAEGITAVGVGTGVYRASINGATCDFVIWDTGGDSPQYATETLEAVASAPVSPGTGGQPTGTGSVTQNADGTQTLIYLLTLPAPAVLTLAGMGTLRQVLTAAGPFAVDLTLPDGAAVDGLPHLSYLLTMTGIPDPVPGLSQGAASALWPLLKDGEPETLDLQITLSSGQPDIRLTLEVPQGDIGASAPGILWGGEGYVHVLVFAKSGQDDASVDYTSLPPRLAVVRADAQDSDFVDGDWLTRTATPTGTYARLYVEGLRRGAYYVYVQITVGGQTITRRAPGTLRVTS